MRLSIIVPIYNVQMYLEANLNSLLEQTFSDFELILVDDGSTDRSGQICDEYQDRNREKIVVIHQHNAGPSAARNAGLKIAKGEYIAFADPDDLVDRQMYEKLVEALECDCSDMAICNIKIFNKSGKDIVNNRYVNGVIEKSVDSFNFFSCGMDGCWNRIYRKDIIHKYALWFEDRRIIAHEDYWFSMRYLSHAERIVFIDAPLYFYRERKSSISKSRSDFDVTDRDIILLNKTYAYIKEYANINCDQFMKYQTLCLFFASINNSGGNGIKTICRKFSETSWFEYAIFDEWIACLYTNAGIRSIYNKTLFWLLRRKAWHMFSVLESVRVKRLCSDRRMGIYFE